MGSELLSEPTLGLILAALATLWVAVIAVIGLLVVYAVRRANIRRRLAPDDEAESDARTAPESDRSTLGWMLYRAGFRSPYASGQFVLATIVFLILGVAFATSVVFLGVVDRITTLLILVPGGVGEVFLPLAWASPWIAATTLAALPWIVVRARRKRRVTAIEQDLPITLDLLAALAETGLGFDAALMRILDVLPFRRPLAQEFRIFQVDVLAGRGRVQALRRLTKRVDVPWFSIFVSAVIQAEQVGGGLAQTLRTQAEDLRNRRRERALALAMAIPVKLVFPLIVCFLPAIMVAAVGPMAYQIVQTLDRFLQQSGVPPS